MLGISRDEVIRMKPSREPWKVHVYPLIDLDMTRQGCKDWHLVGIGTAKVQAGQLFVFIRMPPFLSLDRVTEGPLLQNPEVGPLRDEVEHRRFVGVLTADGRVTPGIAFLNRYFLFHKRCGVVTH